MPGYEPGVLLSELPRLKATGPVDLSPFGRLAGLSPAESCALCPWSHHRTPHDLPSAHVTTAFLPPLGRGFCPCLPRGCRSAGTLSSNWMICRVRLAVVVSQGNGHYGYRG